MRHKVLIVDDVPVNLMLLESILEGEYDVVKATSGKEALELMSMPPFPSLALLDVFMPEMSGFELFSQMQEHIILKTVPVIFLSGDLDIASEEEGLALGAADYIRKPYSPKVILKKVSTHIELKLFKEDLSSMAAAQTRQFEILAEELAASHSAIIMGMSLLSESRDQVTGSHLTRVKLLTQLIAEIFAFKHPDKLTYMDASLITTYSPLHDVGKVGVPDAVLKKQGGLSKEEFDQMKAHTLSGGDLLRQVAVLLPNGQDRIGVAIDIAECHHERYDGTGYPRGLVGEEIPLAARIVALADTYDALRSPRQYKPAFTHENAMDIILKGDGRTSPSHFDPLVLAIVEDIHEELRNAYDSNPDTGNIYQG